MFDSLVENAINEARHNRSKLTLSTEVGCYYCRQIFFPSEITEWTDDDSTALCPKCGIDSVIPRRTIEFAELLRLARIRWFGEDKPR